MSACGLQSMVLVGWCMTFAACIEMCGVESGVLRLRNTSLRYQCTPADDCEPAYVKSHYVSDSNSLRENLGHCFIWRRERETECRLCTPSCCRIAGRRRGALTECVDYLSFFNFTEPRRDIWKLENVGEVTFVIKSEESRNLDVYVELWNFCAFCHQIVHIQNSTLSFFGLCTLDAIRGNTCPRGEYWSNGRCSVPKRV